MATYLELMERAQKLMAEAEEVRQKEIDDVIADIRQKMEAYGLTLQDIGGPAAGRKRAAPPKARPSNTVARTAKPGAAVAVANRVGSRRR